MTVGQQQQDLYGARLDRKNIPPPLSISIPNLQQHYVNTFPKSAPAQTNNSSTDLMQLQLQMMLQNNELSKNPGLQTQFSSPLPQMYSPTPVSQAPGPLDSPNGDNKNSANRYKTELCRPYEESGGCKYGEKCQFAHGLHELRDLSRHPKYKTDLCRTFHTIGFCPYGPRCHFIHNTEEKRAPPISPGPHNSGSNATLQNLPALLSLLQQSNVNKLMSCLRKMQLQLGANSTDEVLQYLNFAVPNLMSPPNTPNMFSFPEYMVPAAQALNQASRSTNNIHSYFNFNLAMKDQHLCSLISAAQISASTAPPPVMPPVFGTPPNLSPAVTPPLSSCESSPLTEVGEMYANQIMAMQQQQMNQQQMINQQHMMSQQMQSAAQMTAQMNLYQEGYQGDKSTEYMAPGRVIKHNDQDLSSVGKRLPIFNQLSISDPVF